MTYLWYASILAQAALITRLARLRLHRAYCWLLALLCFAIFRSLLLAVVSHSGQYYTVWLLTEPVLILLKAFVAKEAADRMARHYGFSPGMLWASLTAATCAGLTASYFSLEHAGSWPGNSAQALNITDQCVEVVLAVWLLCVVCLSKLLELKAAKNLERHTRMVALYFATVAGFRLAMNAHVADQKSLNFWLTGATGLLYLIWATAFRGDDEQIPQVVIAPQKISMKELLSLLRQQFRKVPIVVGDQQAFDVTQR